MARKTPKTLFTIGYEQTPARAVFDELQRAGVRLLVDVRAVVSSRRPGFSKSQLAAELEERGISYLHLRGLGTPKEGRMAARKGDATALKRIYATHLKTAQARLDAENKAKADAAAKKNEQQLGGSQQTALKPTEQATLNAAKTFDAGTGNLASTGTETTALIFTSITLATLGLAAWGPSRRKAAKPRHAA